MTDCEIVKFGIYLWTFPTGTTYEINTAETGPISLKKYVKICGNKTEMFHFYAETPVLG